MLVRQKYSGKISTNPENLRYGINNGQNASLKGVQRQMDW